MTMIYSKARSLRLKTKIEGLRESLFREMEQHKHAELKMLQNRDTMLTRVLRIRLWRLVQDKLRGCDNAKYLKSLDSDAACFDQSLNGKVMLGSVASSAMSYSQDCRGSVDSCLYWKKNEELTGKEVDDEGMLIEEEGKGLDILDEDPWCNRGSSMGNLFCDNIGVEQEMNLHGASVDEEQMLFEGSDRGASRSYMSLLIDDSWIRDEERLHGFSHETPPLL